VAILQKVDRLGEREMTDATDTASVAHRDRVHSRAESYERFEDVPYASFQRRDEALECARIYLKFLWQFLQPVSVLDVGCGSGTWLKACHELGSRTFFGLDGEWSSQSLMIDPDINFRGIDLNKPFLAPAKVDMAINLEVAEHLEPSTGPQLIQCLVEASDVVLFSAAYTGQGGYGHINERLHSYWAQLFATYDFAAFDLFRPVFWDNEKIFMWYRQNIFLYVRKNSTSYQQIKGHGVDEMTNISFMNCPHPELYDSKCAPCELPPVGFRRHLADLIPSLGRALRRRLGFLLESGSGHARGP
jgi:SAM-dependent methyltransferase